MSGMRTPWGDADYEREYAPGIVFYATPSHGGFKLSADRVKQIPEPLRGLSGYPQSWYEEDCSWAAVAWIFPEAFVDAARVRGPQWHTVEDVKQYAYDTLLRWYPDELQQVTGQQTLPVG